MEPDVAGNYSVSLTVSDGTHLSETTSMTISTTNRAPVSLAGDDFRVKVGDNLILDGSSSYDPDNDLISYLWTSNDSSATSNNKIWDLGTVQTPDSITPVTYTLRVTDSSNMYTEDQVIVSYQPTYTDNGDGTVSDGLGHAWEKLDDDVLYTRTFAVELDPEIYIFYKCSNLILGGRDDWRLPTVNELLLLTETNSSSPSIDLNIFPNTNSGFYASSHMTGNVTINGVDFTDGLIASDTQGYVRCVRDQH